MALITSVHGQATWSADTVGGGAGFQEGEPASQHPLGDWEQRYTTNVHGGVTHYTIMGQRYTTMSINIIGGTWPPERLMHRTWFVQVAEALTTPDTQQSPTWSP